VRLVRDLDGRDPDAEVATLRSWLDRVAGGEEPGVLRVYRPAPTVAFGRLDAIRPGYAGAVDVAREHGFAPVLRVAGGHAAAFHSGCVCVEEIVADSDPIPHVNERFARTAELVRAALASLGVDARVGEVPGEYCPGAWTVNARGAVKLAGTAQRIVRGAWLMAIVVVAEDARTLAPVLVDVYAALELPMDPATVGAAHDEAPAATVGAVERVLLAACTA
jgi:octanoyl-[GcvH]:protein N-octanoyltransferase